MVVKAVILVGGPSKATRFRPLSFVAPKPLFPVAGSPLLHQHVRACARVKDIQEIILVGFFPEDQLADYVREASAEVGVRVVYLRETTQLGTAGGLHKFRQRLTDTLSASGLLLVLHCDVLCDFPLAEMLAFHRQHGGQATMLAKQVGRTEAHHYGCVVVDEKDASVLHYAEKPETFVSDLANCGLYVFSTSIFATLAAVAQAKAARAETLPVYAALRSSVQGGDVRMRLEQDLLMPLAGSRQLYAMQTQGPFLQIKRPSSALAASRLLLGKALGSDGRDGGSVSGSVGRMVVPDCRLRGDVLAHCTAVVHQTACLGPNVTLGPGVVVGAGVRLRNCIVLEGVVLEAHACVINAIIGWRSRIGQWARVEGSDETEHVTIFGEGVQAAREICVRDSIVLPHKELTQNHAGKIIL